MKGEILICTGLMLNDHSNPYIESTTVLSDTCATNVQRSGLIKNPPSLPLVTLIKQAHNGRHVQ